MRYVIASLLLIASVADSASTLSTPMQAHEAPASGAWFEGWYTRVSDPSQNLSFAIIAASARPEQKTRAFKARGYAAIIVQQNSLIRAEQSFPAKTSIANSTSDFKWTDGKNTLTTKTANLQINTLEAHIDIVQRKPWGGEGPEGRLATLPLPLHWYVDNTGGRANYSITIDGHTIKGTGFVHQEKNWGQAFPSAWIWSQAVDDDAYLAVAGGDLDTGPVVTHSYLIGYRSKAAQVNFNPSALARYTDAIDACENHVTLEATNPDYHLVITMDADEDFVSLAIPTRTGFVKGGARETFGAHIQTKLYKKTWFTEELIEEHTFESAALEFGAASQACERSPQ